MAPLSSHDGHNRLAQALTIQEGGCSGMHRSGVWRLSALGSFVRKFLSFSYSSLVSREGRSGVCVCVPCFDTLFGRSAFMKASEAGS